MPDDDRLALLYDLSRRLATFTDLHELLRYTTRRVRELLEADGCAILLHDAARGELYFPVSSQAESRQRAEARLAEIRFPADKGIAGAVLASARPVVVEDVTRDPRFYPQIDRLTGDPTRSILCAPLRTPAGTFGVVEVINPPARFLSPAALEFLDTIASDIAIAYEKGRLYEALRTTIVDLRRVCRYVGAALVAIGLVIAAAAVLAHLAWALPVRELPGRTGVWGGVLSILAGIVLVVASRRRLAVQDAVP